VCSGGGISQPIVIDQAYVHFVRTKDIIEVNILSIISIVDYIQLIVISDEGHRLLHRVRLISDDRCSLLPYIRLNVLNVKRNVFMRFGIVRLLGITGVVCLTSSLLIRPVAVSSTAIVLWTLARIGIPAFAGLVPKVSAHRALWFALEEALRYVVIIAVAYPAARL